MNRLTQLASAFALAATTIAQDVPFMVTGSLDGCSAGTADNSGGSVSVNNWDITVPENLIVSFPTTFAPFKQLCGAGAGGFETTVVGNIVGGTVIAGQITVAQRFGVEGSQGYISAINDDGSMQIRNGPKIRLNDPDGFYAPATQGNAQWVVDPTNPSVTSFSGFPMCVPGANNAKCDKTNRGNGQTFEAPNPLKMVPIAVGDFVEYSALKGGNGEMLVSEITVISLHITTPNDGKAPNYVRVEEMLVGVPDTAPNVEFAPMRVVGYASKCSGTIITVSAIDVDPCTGKKTYREMGTTSPKQETRCKWELRVDNPGSPFTREYRVTTNGPIVKTEDGIEAGQYVTPVTEWIFPEVDVPGTNPPPYPFDKISDVAQGTVLDGKQYGQLKPFPAGGAPTVSKVCSPSDLDTSTPTPTPSADPSSPAPTGGSAVAPQARAAPFANTVRTGVDVTLSGSNAASNPAPDNTYEFKWTQVSPATPQISLTGADTQNATFSAPGVSSETPFLFNFTITSKTDPTVASWANTTVKISQSIPDNVTMDTYLWKSSGSGTIKVECSSNVKTTDLTGMNVIINPSNSPRTLAMTKLSAGRWQLPETRNVKQPTNLKCASVFASGKGPGGESALRQGTATTGAFKRRRRAAHWFY